MIKSQYKITSPCTQGSNPRHIAIIIQFIQGRLDSHASVFCSLVLIKINKLTGSRHKFKTMIRKNFAFWCHRSKISSLLRGTLHVNFRGCRFAIIRRLHVNFIRFPFHGWSKIKINRSLSTLHLSVNFPFVNRLITDRKFHGSQHHIFTDRTSHRDRFIQHGGLHVTRVIEKQQWFFLGNNRHVDIFHINTILVRHLQGQRIDIYIFLFKHINGIMRYDFPTITPFECGRFIRILRFGCKSSGNSTISHRRRLQLNLGCQPINHRHFYLLLHTSVICIQTEIDKTLS